MGAKLVVSYGYHNPTQMAFRIPMIWYMVARDMEGRWKGQGRERLGVVT